MRYKWIWSLVVVLIIAICLLIFLPLNEEQRTPSSLPNENQLKKMILETGDVNIKSIFEQMAIDDNHIFMPHLSSPELFIR